MSKNLTLKGLAFGALLALGATVIAGAPANAGVTGTSKVTLSAATGGEVYNVLTGSEKTFQLSSVVANSLRGAATTGLKWIVEDASRTVVPSVQNSATPGSITLGTYDSTTNKRIVDSADYAAEITLTTALNETAARTVKVTAFYDDNNNGIIDADEYEVTQTVNFVTAASVASSVVVTSPIIGDTSFAGYVVTAPVLNYVQSTAPSVATSWQGNAGTFAATVSQDATNKRFKFVAERSYAIASAADVATDASVVTSTGHTLANGEKVTVAGLAAATGTTTGLNGTKTVSAVGTDIFTIAAGGGTGAVTATAATAKVQVVAGTYSATPSLAGTAGAKNTFGVGAATAATSKASVVSSKDVKVANNATTAVTATVRAAVKSVSASFAFVDSSSVALGANKPVRVTATITNATGVTLNGTSVTTGGSIDAVTDASGNLTVAVVTTSGVANDSVVLSAVAEGVAGSASTATFNWSAGTLSLNDLADSGSSLVRSIAVGGSNSFDFAITDSWGQLVSGDYRLKVAVSGNTVSETYPDLSTGRATVTVSDAKIASGNVSVAVTAQKKNTAGTWEDSTANAALPAVVTYTLIPQAQTNGALTVPAAQTAASSTATLVAGDTRTSQDAVTSLATAPITINGVVADATTNAVKPGALVTISGPSTMLFTTGTKAAYGSLSIFADATTGAYSFDVISNTAQKESVVTVSALGGSKTLKVTFNPALDNAGTALVITAPATQLPGRTFQISASLKDKYGNAVETDGVNTAAAGADISVTYVGPGFVTSTLPAKFDSTGSLVFSVLLAASDSGTGTVTVKYDANGDNDFADTGDIIKTATVVVATVDPSAIVNVVGHRVYVKFADSKGEEVSAVIGGVRITKIATYNNYVVSRLIKKPGKYAVKAYVAGDLVKASTVTVK